MKVLCVCVFFIACLKNFFSSPDGAWKIIPHELSGEDRAFWLSRMQEVIAVGKDCFNRCFQKTCETKGIDSQKVQWPAFRLIPLDMAKLPQESCMDSSQKQGEPKVVNVHLQNWKGAQSNHLDLCMIYAAICHALYHYLDRVAPPWQPLKLKRSFSGRDFSRCKKVLALKTPEKAFDWIPEDMKRRHERLWGMGAPSIWRLREEMHAKFFELNVLKPLILRPQGLPGLLRAFLAR